MNYLRKQIRKYVKKKNNYLIDGTEIKEINSKIKELKDILNGDNILTDSEIKDLEGKIESLKKKKIKKDTMLSQEDCEKLKGKEIDELLKQKKLPVYGTKKNKCERLLKNTSKQLPKQLPKQLSKQQEKDILDISKCNKNKNHKRKL